MAQMRALQRPQIVRGTVQAIHEKPHAIDAGEDQPVVAGQICSMAAIERAPDLRRLNRDHRQLDRLRTQRRAGAPTIRRPGPCARVTTILCPNSGSFSNQFSFSRRPTTSPMIIVAGGFRLRSLDLDRRWWPACRRWSPDRAAWPSARPSPEYRAERPCDMISRAISRIARCP